MDEMRVCGNGHLFPFAAGSCPECDSVASRPATRAEIEAGGSAAATPAGDELKESLALWFVMGAATFALSLALVGIAIAADLSVLGVIGYIGYLVAVVLLLIGVVGLGVREGMNAHVAGLRRRDGVSGSVRRPS